MASSQNIQPYMIGSGRAAQALEKSLRMLEVTDPEFHFEKTIQVERGQALNEVFKKSKDSLSLLLIANPHALHAERILEADAAGFDLIVTEKPVCTSLEEISALKKVSTKVAVCHGYRQSWGVQTLKSMLDAGEFGEVISVEGRYWQSSTAQRALDAQAGKGATQSWKNNPKLSGPNDALLDIGTHWADAALFLLGKNPLKTEVRLSYKNAEAAHRDSHMHLRMEFDQGISALCSISKTVHGSSNHFEINIIGTKKYACWKFLEFDLLEIGEGNRRSFISRPSSGPAAEMGTQQGPHHGVGWLEGYIEILRQSLRHTTQREYVKYPDLKDGLGVVEVLLKGLF